MDRPGRRRARRSPRAVTATSTISAERAPAGCARKRRQEGDAARSLVRRSADRGSRRADRPARLASTTTTEDTNRMPSSRLRSRCSSASNTRRPSPGQPNTVSTRIEPPSRWPTCTPASVTTGSSALRAAWSRRRALPTSPLARAVVMYSWRTPPASRPASGARRSRYRTARASASAAAGAWRRRSPAHPVIRWPIVIMPPEGRMPSVIENSTISIRPSQNCGVA